MPEQLSITTTMTNVKLHEDSALGAREGYGRRRFRRRYRDVHAVRGARFELHEGESLGVIGANGSGKSTLPAVLTRPLPIERGTITVRSRPILLGGGAVLRLGISGRRNIALGCLAAGMTPDEADARIDEIVWFSGLADFIDMPMRARSSGMRARVNEIKSSCARAM